MRREMQTLFDLGVDAVVTDDVTTGLEVLNRTDASTGAGNRRTR
jgi:glycerophosphoryl diester phosphodiesterase